MTSDDFLINHAYNNVWCAPEQDYQHIFRPARLSPPIGARGSTDLIWSRYTLPTAGDWYHLFQIGPVIFKNLNLSLLNETWTSAGSLMIKQRMLIDVYTEGGRMVPRERVFFLATPDGNLCVAVRDTKGIANFGAEPVYLRFYSNAYFNRNDVSDAAEGIEYRYFTPTSTDAISTASKVWRDMNEKSGKCFAYINGWKVQSLNVATMKKGDMVEMVRDSSIREILEFPVTQLPTFLSTLDKKQKYLLHQPIKRGAYIDYRDDLDIYLVKRSNANAYTGVYYHRNAEDSMRMVTHRDYSIPAAYLESYTQSNGAWARTDQLTVQLVLRHAGLERPLLDEAHHIKELYRLSEMDFMQALIGTDAVVSVWQAAALEQSQYTALMRATAGTITRTMVEEAYGYNAIGRLLADTPQKIETVNGWVELPFGLRGESTVYEYDADGLLLGWYLNINVQWYVARSKACKYVEAIPGRGGRSLSTVYGADAPSVPGYNYRCYVCTIDNTLPDGKWKDVTGDVNYYQVINGKITWTVDRKRIYTAVKRDDSFLTYNLDLDYQDALLRLSLNVAEVRIDGNLYNGLNEIPFGVLELWLNGHSLIEGLDWFMVDQEIVIVNKVYRTRDGKANRITIRGTGFCNADMSRIAQAEFGFVEQGWLSRNNRWNLRDDKVIRVTAGGRLFARSELNFAEDTGGVRLNAVANGAPYQVLEPVIPLRGATLEDTYALRAVAMKVDNEIEDYMTQRYPDQVLDTPNLIPGPHVLYSPFIGKVMHDLIAGYIREEDLTGRFSDTKVKELCKSYEWLLKYEPTYKGFNDRYVSIHPHESYEPFELGIYQYNFLRRVVRLYLEDKVDISHFISIKPLE